MYETKKKGHTLLASTQRCFNVYTTSITLGRRRMNVKMMLCAYAYWAISTKPLVLYLF